MGCRQVLLAVALLGALVSAALPRSAFADWRTLQTAVLQPSKMPSNARAVETDIRNADAARDEGVSEALVDRMGRVDGFQAEYHLHYTGHVLCCVYNIVTEWKTPADARRGYLWKIGRENQGLNPKTYVQQTVWLRLRTLHVCTWDFRDSGQWWVVVRAVRGKYEVYLLIVYWAETISTGTVVHRAIGYADKVTGRIR